jgi:hypothetical protein
MEAAIDRIMHTYDLLVNRTAAANDEARAKVTEYLATLVEAGEKDPDLFAPARRQQRSGEGGIYGAVAERPLAPRPGGARAKATLPKGALLPCALHHRFRDPIDGGSP